MGPKKKKSDSDTLVGKDKEGERAPAPVMEVVEVVEDEGSELSSHPKAPESLSEEKTEVETEPETVSEHEEESEPEIEVSTHTAKQDWPKDREVEKPRSPEPTPHQAEREMEAPKEEKRKATVEELFTKDEQVGMPEISVHTNSTGKKGMLMWAVVMCVIAIVLGGGLLYLTKGNNKIPTIVVQTTPTPTVGETPSPTPTPQPISKADLKILVLNGGGKVGAGAKMKEFLTGKGYTAPDTKNADAFTYTQTEIHVKPDKAAILPTLKADLSDTYTVGTAAADLASSINYDAQIIVGK